MSVEDQDPLLWSARRERARRWLSTDLRGYPTLSAEEEAEPTIPPALNDRRPRYDSPSASPCYTSESRPAWKNGAAFGIFVCALRARLL
jgi:hypothetical protein